MAAHRHCGPTKFGFGSAELRQTTTEFGPMLARIVPISLADFCSIWSDRGPIWAEVGPKSATFGPMPANLNRCMSILHRRLAVFDRVWSSFGPNAAKSGSILPKFGRGSTRFVLAGFDPGRGRILGPEGWLHSTVYLVMGGCLLLLQVRGQPWLVEQSVAGEGGRGGDELLEHHSKLAPPCSRFSTDAPKALQNSANLAPQSSFSVITCVRRQIRPLLVTLD